MSPKLTIFTIFAFEIALIIFMVAWSAWAQSNQMRFNVIAPLSCLNNIGEQVQFKTVKTTGAKGAAGMAERDEINEGNGCRGFSCFNHAKSNFKYHALYSKGYFGRDFC